MADEDAFIGVGDEAEDVEEEVVDEEGVVEDEGGRATIPDPLESLYKLHPETILDYADAIAAKVPLRVATSTENNVDTLHRSQPFLTVYEKTKILGFRANQLAQGAPPYVDVPTHIVNTLDIAKLELEQRRLPFILKRPMPDGTFEYWRLSDLMVI